MFRILVLSVFHATLGIFDYRLKAQGSSHPNETDMQSMCLSFHGVEIVLYSFLI